MNLRTRLGRAARLIAGAAAITGLSLMSVATASSAQAVTSLHCTLQTASFNYVTAVDGGGRTTDVLHTNATQAFDWEKFGWVEAGGGKIGLQTFNGHYLTAVEGGGFTRNSVRSNETQLRDWEKFTPISLGAGRWAFKTVNGHYLSSFLGGGQTADGAINTAATFPGFWEQYRVSCTN